MNIDKKFNLPSRLGQGRDIGDRAEQIYKYLKDVDNNPSLDKDPTPGVVNTGDSFENGSAYLHYDRSADIVLSMGFQKGDYSLAAGYEVDMYRPFTDIQETRGNNPTESARVHSYDKDWEIADGSDLLPTPEDIEGPYYRHGAPERADVHPGLEGDRLKLAFQVRNEDGHIVPDAKVQIWMADEKGVYDEKGADFKGRGWQMADDKGKVGFESLRPGNYQANGEFRPAHLHLKLSAPGHKELTTQLYFKDDPHNHKDPWFNENNVLYEDVHNPRKVAESKGGPISLDGSEPIRVELEKVPQEMSYHFVLERAAQG